MLKRYDHIILADIEDSSPQDWPVDVTATHMRVTLPANSAAEIEMQRRGFLWADRTLKASVSLSKLKDVCGGGGLSVVETADYKKEILEIAASSFETDRRFHLTPDCCPAVARRVLEEWVNKLDKVLVCKFHDKVIGFCALVPSSEHALFVHLAAVSEKYRLTGAAVALYSHACKLAREQGRKRLEGRISSSNTAVMNIYAALGAVFSEPRDIFLKQLKGGNND